MLNEFESLCNDVLNEGWRARFKGLRSGIKDSKQAITDKRRETRVLYNNIRVDSALNGILEKFRYKALRAIDKDTEEIYKDIKNMSGVIDQHINGVTDQIKKTSDKYKHEVNTNALESQFSIDIDNQLNNFRNDVDSAVNKLKDAIRAYQFKS